MPTDRERAVERTRPSREEARRATGSVPPNHMLYRCPLCGATMFKAWLGFRKCSNPKCGHLGR